MRTRSARSTAGTAKWTGRRSAISTRAFSQTTLAGFYRAAAVGLVTPFQDGMNLVAKEYVAAQNPDNPGVLVLSEFAGAARELDAAVLVNPHDIDGMAQKLIAAIDMPLSERIERWTSMMKALRRSSIHVWFADFMDALGRTRTAAANVPASRVAMRGPANLRA